MKDRAKKQETLERYYDGISEDIKKMTTKELEESLKEEKRASDELTEW